MTPYHINDGHDAPEEWVETWPDPDRPRAVACFTCGKIYPVQQMRRPLTPTERERGLHGWMDVDVCAPCRRAAAKPESPSAMRRRLINEAKLPVEIIDMRMTALQAQRKEAKIAKLRARWAALHREDTKALVDEMVREKKRIRTKADRAIPLAREALLSYFELLSQAITAVRLRAKEGKAPFTPWWEGLYRYPHLLRRLEAMVNLYLQAMAQHPQNMTGAIPLWWDDRERLLKGKPLPNDDQGPAIPEGMDPASIEALHIVARHQWDKRRLGKRRSRADKILEELANDALANQIAEHPPEGTAPLTADDFIIKKKVKQVDVPPADVLIPRRMPAPPVADGPTAEEIAAENEAYLRQLGLID